MGNMKSGLGKDRERGTVHSHSRMREAHSKKLTPAADFSLMVNLQSLSQLFDRSLRHFFTRPSRETGLRSQRS